MKKQTTKRSSRRARRSAPSEETPAAASAEAEQMDTSTETAGQAPAEAAVATGEGGAGASVAGEAPAEQAAATDQAASTETPEPTAHVVVLPSSCTVREAAALKVELCTAARETHAAVDARAVERIDTAALQLLCAFVKRREHEQRPVEWLGTSQNFDEAVRLLGAATLLGRPEVAGEAAA
ncbi:MAG: hypothetical protein DIU71_05865 [Proteobacteria bacterium]|nr:MAG: hypothetical protein DIU71_05865 [Pseudomonadota bacterium]